MTTQPIPPDQGTIQRLEAARAGRGHDHMLTGVAPLTTDHQQNRVHMKNLIRAVTRAVGEHDSAAARELEHGLAERVEQVRPPHRPGSWFVATDGAETHSFVLPEPFDELVVDDRHYYVRPLIQSAATHGEFLLLALSLGETCAYRIAGDNMEAFGVADLPRNLQEVVGDEVDGGTLQQHVTDRAIFHGHGGGHDDRTAEVEQFLRAVDEALCNDPRAREQHVMIAAVNELAARYRALSEHRHLFDQVVELSPDQTREAELHEAAQAAFETWRREDTAAFLESLAEQAPHHLTDDPSSVVRASQEGRVDTLVTSRDAFLWGRFDPQAWDVEIHPERRGDSRDLVDVAMRAAWRQGGRIRIVEADALATPMQARLRY